MNPDFSKTRIFQGLTEEEIKIVESYLVQMHYPKGKQIIEENSEGSRLYILASGKVYVTKNLVMDILDSHDAEEKRLATLTGDCLPSFGENGLITKGLRTANVIAGEDCTVYELSGEDFEELVSQDVTIGYKVVKNIADIVCGRLEQTDKSVVKLATALYLSVGDRK